MRAVRTHAHENDIVAVPAATDEGRKPAAHAAFAAPKRMKMVEFCRWLAMDEGRIYCDATSSRSSLTWLPQRTHDCCRPFVSSTRNRLFLFRQPPL
jgi:hypothetical protein